MDKVEMDKILKIKDVRVKYGRTFNTGQYESVRIDAELGITIEDAKEVNAVTNAAYRYLKGKVLEWYGEEG